ncbi:MAG: DUF3373 family protein, partial [Campylobacterota bacterium]|nr:DUF3373 family protein [Campylobacterota bacterium]
LADKLSALEVELADVKKDLAKQNSKLNKVKAHDANDNIKWGVDLRTGIDNINYDMADGESYGKDDLMSIRLWLNMAYAPDSHNIFKGQLSMNKAFGADFGGRGWGMDNFDWVANEALTNSNLKVRQAYWLYMADEAFGADIPWTFSLGRRPSTNGFLANLSQDDSAQSPLGHVINVEFDGLSSKLDLSNITGVPGMSFKLCMGQGSTNAKPMFQENGTQYANDDDMVEDVKLAGFIFEPYNDGQFIVKTTAYKAFDVPGYVAGHMVWNPAYSTYMPDPSSMELKNTGDMEGAAISVLVDGLSDDGYLSDVKVFGSFAWSNSNANIANPRDFTGGLYDGATDVPVESMFGTDADESGTSYWFGTYLPVLGGTLGLEYNHGSQYWKPFTQGEDTMIGSKMAVRGDAWEVNYTYQLTDALSIQARYVALDYEYTGSQGFYGDGGYAMSIDDLKAAAALGDPTALGMVGGIVDKAQDARLYLRYRF